jgi:CHASE3 domain sensor protein
MRAFASPAVQHPHFTARTASCVAGILGLTALTGWAFDIPALKSAAPGFIAMQPWTATAIILAAAALWLARFDGSAARAVSAIAAIALAIIVGLPIFEYATGANLGTDVLLFPNSVVSTQTVPYPNPGRMSPLTSTGLVSLAAALLLAPRVQGRVESIVFSALASVGLALTAVSAVSYVLRLESLDSMVLHNPVAIPTALALAALSLGTLTLRPDAGWVAIVAKQGSPGWLAAGLLGGAVLLLMFGSEAAVTMGVVDRATFEAARRLDHLLSTLKDAETGQRGFLLTGQDSYLEPYEAARASLSDEFERAEASLAQAYGSPSRLTTLRSLVTAKMAELAETVALRRAGDAAGAVVVVQRGRGQSLMEAIRSQVDVLSLALGNAGPANGARIETAAAIAGLGAVGLAALAFWSLIAAGRVTREASESAEESAARQRDLLATLSLGTFMARDMNGVIRYWAEGCARLYGWTVVPPTNY